MARHRGSVYGHSTDRAPGSKHLYRPTWSGGKWNEFVATRSIGRLLQVCCGGSRMGIARVDIERTVPGVNVVSSAFVLPFGNGAFDTVACDPRYGWTYMERVRLQRELARVALRRILFKAPWIPRATGWKLVETVLVASETCANVAVLSSLHCIARQLDVFPRGGGAELVSSPRFGVRGVVVDAIATAVREAWAVPATANGVAVMQRALRRILGDPLGEQAISAAVAVLRVQPEVPVGDLEPPAAELQLCVRCRQVKLKEERKPYRGKTRMEFLRDPQWMARQFEQMGKGDAQVAAELGCCQQSVMEWRQRHHIEPGKQHQPWMHEATMRRLIVDRRLAPGEVGKELGCDPGTARRWASRQGIATGKRGWAHQERAWWTERVAAGWTQYAMAEGAGIVTHAVLYHLRKWGLWTKRTPYERSHLKQPTYRQLYEPNWLRRQLATYAGRGAYAGIARKVGCSPTAVAAAAKKLGLHQPHAPALPTPWTKDAAWYRERIAKRITVAQMATETGCKEKSIWNYMGKLGVLEDYYQQVERWGDRALARVRAHTLRRFAQSAAVA